MNIPESMREELGAWNNGKGIDLESWVSCEGNYSLAVGYSTIFCPKFVEFEDYIFALEKTDYGVRSCNHAFVSIGPVYG